MSPDGLAPHKTSKPPNEQFLVPLWGVVTEPWAIGAFQKHSCYITTLRKNQEQSESLKRGSRGGTGAKLGKT